MTKVTHPVETKRRGYNPKAHAVLRLYDGFSLEAVGNTDSVQVHVH